MWCMERTLIKDKMKTLRHLVLAAALFAAAVSSNAQTRSFFDCLTLPVEAGVAVTPGGAAKPGMYMKMSLEYRPQNTRGWYASLEYDDYDQAYSGFKADGVNSVTGTEKNLNILVGAGYRFPIVPDALSVACLLQPGISIATLENVSAGQEGCYDLAGVDYSCFAAKLTAQLDWFINRNFSILGAAGYIQYAGPRPLETGNLGTFTATVGFTTFF